MNRPGEPLSLAQARAVQARGLALPPHELPGPLILDSWARCAARGLAADSRLSLPTVTAPELARRREQAEAVRRFARAELETLAQQIAGSDFLLAFADSEGVILDLYADNRFAMGSADAGILPGSCWSEAAAGTNGLGTALECGQAVAVTGPEHYLLRLSGVSCTAAPVRDAAGRMVGVLDASSHYESRQRHTQALVQMAATHIENSLLTQQMQGAWVLALHPRAEYLGTLSAGLLAFDGEGRLAAINAPAQRLLAGLDHARGTAFEVLFGEPMAHVLARLHRGGDVRLRDALGSTLVARLVHRPAVAPLRPVQPLAKPLAAAPAASPPHTAPRFLAGDPAVAEACRLAEAAVRMGVPVLLQGETGTGKELVARHAHEASGRGGAFVAVNCAALPAELFEAELFGHAAGAFTGARREGHAGLIVQAHGGTLLLDELRELPLPLQAALLRFLDDQLVRPLGSTRTQKVDVQLLAATHADLEAEVRAQRFREDLFYRLNTVRVWLPPLRERQDRAEAVQWVLQQLAPRASLDEAALARLLQHRWPGNFRELRSLLTRVLLGRGGAAEGSITEAEVLAQLPALNGVPAPVAASALQRNAGELVRAEYERCGRSVSRTARVLGVSRTTVYRHLNAAGTLTRG